METLSEMEKIEVDNKDRPIEDIVILKAQIFVDPYEEADEQVRNMKFDDLWWIFLISVGERARRRNKKTGGRRAVEKKKIGSSKVT